MTDKEKVESQKTKDIQSYLNNLSKNRLKKVEESKSDVLDKLKKHNETKKKLVSFPGSDKIKTTKSTVITSQGKFVNGKKVEEEVEPIEESVMDTLHKIVAGKSAQSVKFASGHSRKVDHYTASAITQVHSAVNDENKKKLADMVHKSPAHFEKVAKFAFSKAK